MGVVVASERYVRVLESLGLGVRSASYKRSALRANNRIKKTHRSRRDGRRQHVQSHRASSRVRRPRSFRSGRVAQPPRRSRAKDWQTRSGTILKDINNFCQRPRVLGTCTFSTGESFRVKTLLLELRIHSIQVDRQAEDSALWGHRR